GRGAYQLDVVERADPGRRLEPLDLALVLGDEDPHPDHLLDRVVVAAHVKAMALEDLLLVGVGLGAFPDVVPPVGVAGDHPEEELLPGSPDHDGRNGAGARLAGGPGDGIVLAVVLDRGLSP